MSNNAEALRGSGTSSRQMLDAPIGSVYIVKNIGTRAYFLDLANHLGRIDLDIQPASVLDGHTLSGRELSGIVIDHAVDLTYAQLKKRNWLEIGVKQKVAV